MPKFPALNPQASGFSANIYSNLVSRAKECGHAFRPLHVGDTHLSPDKAILFGGDEEYYTYSNVQGDPILLDAIGKSLAQRAPRHKVDPENIQVVASGTNGMTLIALTILSPGEEVLLLSPFWPLIRGIITLAHAVPVEVPVFTHVKEPGFDVEAVLERNITDKTVAVYVNSPHNPTGVVLPEAAVEAIARVARRHGLWVISDEAYEDIYYSPAPPPPTWARDSLFDIAISCHTFSKAYAIAGARVGYIHGPPEVMKCLRGVQTFAQYCAPRPGQIVAARALERSAEWQANTRRVYAEAGFAAADLLGLPRPEGGCFLFFDAAPYFREGEDLNGLLARLADRGVLVAAGGACGRHYATHVRMCFTSQPPAEALQGVRTLVEVLRDNGKTA